MNRKHYLSIYYASLKVNFIKENAIPINGGATINAAVSAKNFSVGVK